MIYTRNETGLFYRTSPEVLTISNNAMKFLEMLYL